MECPSVVAERGRCAPTVAACQASKPCANTHIDSYLVELTLPSEGARIGWWQLNAVVPKDAPASAMPDNTPRCCGSSATPHCRDADAPQPHARIHQPFRCVVPLGPAHEERSERRQSAPNASAGRKPLLAFGPGGGHHPRAGHPIRGSAQERVFELLTATLSFGLQDGQLRDLGPNQLLPGPEAFPVVEKLTDLTKAEPGVLPHANHADTVNGFGRITTLTRNARRRRQEALSLIKAQRGNRDVGRPSQFSDAQSNNHLT